MRGIRNETGIRVRGLRVEAGMRVKDISDESLQG